MGLKYRYTFKVILCTNTSNEMLVLKPAPIKPVINLVSWLNWTVATFWLGDAYKPFPLFLCGQYDTCPRRTKSVKMQFAMTDVSGRELSRSHQSKQRYINTEITWYTVRLWQKLNHVIESIISIETKKGTQDTFAKWTIFPIY